MPNLPLLQAPENVSSAPLSGGARASLLRPSTVSPTLTTATRADPNMFAGIAAASRQIGAGVEEFGDIAFRIKNAQDSAYITRAQTAMEGASLEFQAWTKTNPDPSTWGAELDERVAAVKENMGDGATALSPLAQQRLKLVTDQWQTRTTRGVQLQATEQSLTNAQADSNEFIALATTQNDLPAIQAKLDEGVKGGIYRPVVAQHILQKSRTQILTNQVNGMIDNDPFTAETVLGMADSFPGMNATLKETLKFRAHKAAEQTRTESMRDMTQSVYAMQNGTGPDVDKAEMLAKAEHEGISPKYVEKLFKPAKTFDADGMAATKVNIAAYDPVADEQHGFRNAAKLTQQIYELNLPPQTTTELLGELKKKSDPQAPINSPTAKGGDVVIAQRFALLEKSAATQVYVPEKGMAGTPGHIPAHWRATTSQAAVDSAMKLRAEVQTAFNQYVEANPKATPADAEQFIHDAFRTRGGGAGAAVFGGKPVNPQTGIVPPLTNAVNVGQSANGNSRLRSQNQSSEAAAMSLVQGGGDAEISQHAPANKRAAVESELQSLRARLSETGKADPASLQSVWRHEIRNASPELRGAVERYMAVSKAPSRGAQEIVPYGTSAQPEPTATNAKGEKMVYRNGSWQPLR